MLWSRSSRIFSWLFVPCTSSAIYQVLCPDDDDISVRWKYIKWNFVKLTPNAVHRTGRGPTWTKEESWGTKQPAWKFQFETEPLDKFAVRHCNFRPKNVMFSAKYYQDKNHIFLASHGTPGSSFFIGKIGILVLQLYSKNQLHPWTIKLANLVLQLLFLG
jgi:hypothetical protein